ncbi:MAG: PC4/YdbC family ssDNA-binding protein [Oscillospiraceae bacterium]|nr:PC4/YdbC family ssDNA-binding protein [Oscillospiraceae bacterium]
MPDFSYQIVKHIGVISEGSGGWAKELNLISWNGKDAKYDIRDWSPDHENMSKGITLAEKDIKSLKALLDELRFDD